MPFAYHLVWLGLYSCVPSYLAKPYQKLNKQTLPVHEMKLKYLLIGANHDHDEIVKIFKACFDSQGNFQKALFEKKVPEYAQYQKRVFAILWEFLRETPRRSDRLPLLNSLQLLITEIQQPKQAIKILVGDFLLEPAKVRYPDRNAMMLAIQFSKPAYGFSHNHVR